MAYRVIPAFTKFSREGMLVGRLLAGYGEIEVNLCHCVAMSGVGLDKAYRDLYGLRGETKRINCADKLGRLGYKKLGLEIEYTGAIADMRFCLSIRNQYAHCQWYDDNTGRLAFVNMEDVTAQPTQIVNLLNLIPRHVDIVLLAQQEAYFAYVGECFDYLNYEGRFLMGQIASRLIAKPQTVNRPLFHNP